MDLLESSILIINNNNNNIILYLRKYNAHLFQPNITFKVGVCVLDSSTYLCDGQDR